jgi:hypothetical protein
MNKFFYLTQWLNLDRFGRDGKSPYVGLGEHSLAKWFHITMFSSFLFANAGFVTILCGTVFWALSHAVWLQQISWQWVGMVMFCHLFSCTSYFLAYYGTNYNMVGWLWLPLTLFGVINNDFFYTAIGFLGGSMGSVTMVVSGTLLIAPYCVINADYWLLLALLPAFLKLFTHILPMFAAGELWVGLKNTAKLIGMNKASAKYKRPVKLLSLSSLYYILLTLSGCLILWYKGANFLMPLTAIIIYLINQSLFRFMDVQSVYVLYVSAFASSVIINPWSWELLLAFVFILNPLPRFLIGRFEKDSLVRVPVFKPFDHSILIEKLDEFLAEVPKDSRVLMAFDDPGENYSLLFDGYRILNEPILFVASKNRIHLFPDWYSVAETNYQGAPSFWGRSIESVKRNMQYWQAKYVVIYTATETEPESEWFEEFFSVATFDWGEWKTLFAEDPPWREKVPPKWWLLALKNVTD